jgi:hypothetical protein
MLMDVFTRKQMGRWVGALVLMVPILAFGLNVLNSTSVVISLSVEGVGERRRMGELVATSRACQTFVAQYDDLFRVQVKLADLERQNNGPFYFRLRAISNPPQDILTLTHDASDVVNRAYHTFEFPPIHDSAGRSYRFCLEAPEAELLNSIAIVGTLEDTYPHGKATFRDMWTWGAQDLDFRLGYEFSMMDKLAILSKRLSAYKPFAFGAQWFYALLGMAYLGLLYLAFFHFIPKR